MTEETARGGFHYFQLVNLCQMMARLLQQPDGVKQRNESVRWPATSMRPSLNVGLLVRQALSTKAGIVYMLYPKYR
jgi:hypothetical protein